VGTKKVRGWFSNPSILIFWGEL
jgi:hypothetical protein